MRNWFYALLLSTAAFAAAANVADDYAATGSVLETSLRAKQDGLSAADAVRQLVAAGADVVAVVQGVVRAYDDCDATYDAVAAGATEVPERSPDIVTAIATLGRCNCTSESAWATVRLQRRLRPDGARSLFKLERACTCAALGVEAATKAAPDKADDILDAALRAGERSAQVVDSIGQVGIRPGPAWGSGEVSTLRVLARQARVCKGDITPRDSFNPSAEWAATDDRYGLGQHTVACGDDEDANQAKDLIISEYAAGERGNRVLELYNGTGSDLDLTQGDYRVEIFFDGADKPGQIVPLGGVIEAGKTLVIGNIGLTGDVRPLADEERGGLVFSPPDAVVLTRGRAKPDCGCAGASVASSINSRQGDGQAARDGIFQRYSATGALQCAGAALRTDIGGEILFVTGTELEAIEQRRGGVLASPN